MMLESNNQLSKNFTLEEFTRSATAQRLNIDNTPKPIHIDNMRHLCNNLLEPLRKVFGPIIITSGFRSPRLNAAVGGTLLSQHIKGEAADISIVSARQGQKMLEWIRDNLLFDQLILEHSTTGSSLWLHVSLKKDKKENRKEVLRQCQRCHKIQLITKFLKTGIDTRRHVCNHCFYTETIIPSRQRAIIRASEKKLKYC